MIILTTTTRAIHGIPEIQVIQELQAVLPVQITAIITAKDILASSATAPAITNATAAVLLIALYVMESIFTSVPAKTVLYTMAEATATHTQQATTMKRAATVRTDMLNAIFAKAPEPTALIL